MANDEQVGYQCDTEEVELDSGGVGGERKEGRGWGSKLMGWSWIITVCRTIDHVSCASIAVHALLHSS